MRLKKRSGELQIVEGLRMRGETSVERSSAQGWSRGDA